MEQAHLVDRVLVIRHNLQIYSRTISGCLTQTGVR